MTGADDPVDAGHASPAIGPGGWCWASDAPAEGPRIEMRQRADGGMDVRTSADPDKVLEFTRGEWLAWLDGVEHREFDHLAEHGTDGVEDDGGAADAPR